ncbi:antitoxin HicB [Clostridium sp. Bc-iso-3]|nr:antitoxin HicB [Clostridium sp. Bc-iso-3]
MKEAYPIIITEEKDGYYVSIPDFDIATQGISIADSITMARDAIGLMGIDMEDDGKELPKPNSVKVQPGEKDIVTLVDVDFAEYRRKHENRAVKKNCTIPSWLNEEAEKAGVNFSKVLQEALQATLKISK